MERVIITISESGKVNIPSGMYGCLKWNWWSCSGWQPRHSEQPSERYIRVEHLTLQQLNDAILPLLKVRLHSTILK